MKGRSNLRRATRFCADGKSSWAPWLLGACAAAAATGAVFTVTLVVHLIVTRVGGAEAGSPSWVIGGWIGPADGWPWFGRYDYCLLALVALFLVLMLLEATLTSLLARSAQLAASAIADRLQRSLHDQAKRLVAVPLMDDVEQPESVRCLEYIERIRAASLTWWRSAPKDICLLVLLLLCCLAVDLFVSLLGLLLVVVAQRISDRLRNRLRNNLLMSEDRLARRRVTMSDRLYTAGVVPLFAPDGEIMDGFDQERRKYNAELGNRSGADSRFTFCMLMLLAGISALMLLVLGLADHIRLTNIAFLGIAALRSVRPAVRLWQLTHNGASADEGASALLEYLDRVPEVGQMSHARALPPLRESLRLEDVTLKAGDVTLLEHVNVTLPAGSMTAVVGTADQAVGAFATVCLRHCDPWLGQVIVDGIDLREVELDTLRQRFTVATRDGLLYTASIAENIRCGRTKFSDDDIERAAKEAGCFEAIELLPHGFQTVVGPDGRKLPQGLAFRIGLARALISTPVLLVVEEPPARSGGENTETHQLLESIREQRTLIVLARQLETLRRADSVTLLHGGKICVQGRHAELLKESALYRHLNYEWFTPFRDLNGEPGRGAALPSRPASMRQQPAGK